jgi:superfamily II DNA or RNA helicase
MKLRDYQVRPVSNVITKLNAGEKVVLAGCPGSGKTEMSIYIIKRMLDSGKRVLVLAHNTIVLKDNFQERWNSYYEDNPNLKIGIPQSYKKGDFDFVVIDEAHENYLAKTVQDIVKDIPIQLLLTGTPSKLIYKGGFHIEVIAMEDVPREFFSKTGIELLSTCYKWTETDYTQDGNLKSTASITKSDTEKSLDVIIDKLIDRVRNKSIDAERFNKPNILTRIKKSLFKSVLGKTMFVCSRTTQADYVNEILNKMGYDSKVSHAKSDEDSELFNQFKNGEFDVLVVVNRGRLGYSDDNLMNIIDMSGTKSPNLIYQMFARCVRGDQSQSKLFLKLAPTGEAMHDLTAVSVNMALSLMFKDVISKFNGKNIKGMFIPIFKKQTEKKEKSGDKRKSTKSNRVIFPEYLTDVLVELKSVRYSTEDQLSVYKMGEIGEIIRDITEGRYNVPNGYWTLDKCLEVANKCKSKSELQKRYRTAYYKINDLNMLDSIFGETKNTNWSVISKDEVLELLKDVNTKTEFNNKLGAGTKIITKRFPEILDSLKVLKKVYTKQDCVDIMSKYKKRVDFRRENPSVYNIVKTKYKEEFDKLLPPDLSKMRNKKTT